MTLNETERLVVNCEIMRLSQRESLAYMKANEHEVSPATFYRIKGKIKKEYLKQAFDIAKEFPYMHMARVNEVELIRTELWRNYHLEKQPYRKASILKMILELQPYASAYAEATKEVMEGELVKRQETVNLPDQGT